MTLAFRDREFVAATASYFHDQYAGEFVDSGSTGTKKTHHVISSGSRDIVICKQSAMDSAGLSSGMIIYTGVPYLAGAVVAATMALSPPAYAAETRPKPHKADVSYVATEVEHNPQLKEAIARIDYLFGKPKGWKGPDSISMPQAVKVAAIQFLRSYFSMRTMAEPFIGLDADGDVTLFWKNELLLMDLSISKNGMYSFYAETKSGASFEADDVLASRPLPDDLAVLLQKNVA